MTPVEQWNKCLEVIKDNVGEQTFSDWFSISTLESYENNIVTIRVPSDLIRQVYEHRFPSIIRAAMRKVYGDNIDLQYKIAIIQNDTQSEIRVASEHRSKISYPADIQQPSSIKNTGFEGISDDNNIDSQLNPKYNFKNYCVGESNKLPFTMAKFIADNPQNSDFNPFFVWGGVGVGKTHLIQSIGTQMKEKNPSLRVLYVTMRLFQQQQQVASMQKHLPDFINFYQSIDVLLIDDLQELKASAPKTMDALFAVFQHLQMHGKKLIFTCDRAPQDLEGINDRLIDRFKWGLVEELRQPDLNLRRDILRLKSAQSGLELSETIIDMIAEEDGRSVRELEGVIMSILSRSIVRNAPITPLLVSEVLGGSGKIPQRRSVNFDMIVETTSEFFGINPDVLFSRNKLRDIADARQIVMYLAKKLTTLSLNSIGQKLNRKHTTVLHGITTISSHIKNEQRLADAVATIEQTLSKIS